MINFQLDNSITKPKHEKMAHIIFNGTPKLPMKLSYTPHSDRPVVVQMSGSGYAAVPNVMIGFNFSVNGQKMATSAVYSNNEEVHRTTVPCTQEVTFPFKMGKDGEGNPIVEPVDIQIEVIPNTICDQNDFLSVMIID